MTDHEFLERAATAVNGGTWHPLTHENPWNPLADDGDALRLAIHLRIHVDPASSSVTTWIFRGHGESRKCDSFEESFEDDENAATRRAIVRAAASLASSDKEKAE